VNIYSTLRVHTWLHHQLHHRLNKNDLMGLKWLHHRLQQKQYRLEQSSSALGVARCGRSAGCVLAVSGPCRLLCWGGGYPVGVSISSSAVTVTSSDTRTRGAEAVRLAPAHTGLSLQDILSLRGFCARINHRFISPVDLHCPHHCTAIAQYTLPPPVHLHCPHYCNTIARLSRNIRPPPDHPFVYHTQNNISNGNVR